MSVCVSWFFWIVRDLPSQVFIILVIIWIQNFNVVIKNHIMITPLVFFIRKPFEYLELWCAFKLGRINDGHTLAEHPYSLCWYFPLFLFTDCRARLQSTSPYREMLQWLQPLEQAAHLPQVGPDDFVLLQLRSHDRPAMAIQSIVQANNLAVLFAVRTVSTCVCACVCADDKLSTISDPFCGFPAKS